MLLFNCFPSNLLFGQDVGMPLCKRNIEEKFEEVTLNVNNKNVAGEIGRIDGEIKEITKKITSLDDSMKMIIQDMKKIKQNISRDIKR